MQKGFIDSVLGTKILIIAIVISLIVLLFMLICVELPFCPLNPGQAVYAVNYLDVINTPYTVASILTNATVEGKPIMTHMYEAFIRGGMDPAKKERLGIEMSRFLGEYDLNYYEISLETDGEDMPILQSGSLQKCGSGLQGVCVQEVSGGFSGGVLMGSCNAGKVEIEGGSNSCSRSFAEARKVCCTAASEEDYNKWLDVKYDRPEKERIGVVKCGPLEKGICSSGGCGSTIRLPEYEDACKLANNGKAPYCCSIDPEVLEIQGKIAEAKIPMFYKDRTGYVKVTTSD